MCCHHSWFSGHLPRSFLIAYMLHFFLRLLSQLRRLIIMKTIKYLTLWLGFQPRRDFRVLEYGQAQTTVVARDCDSRNDRDFHPCPRTNIRDKPGWLQGLNPRGILLVLVGIFWLSNIWWHCPSPLVPNVHSQQHEIFRDIFAFGQASQYWVFTQWKCFSNKPVSLYNTYYTTVFSRILSISQEIRHD